MYNVIEMINIVTPLVAITFVLIICSLNLYKKIRRKFPIVVNCWFCNTDCKVPYDNLNSFICFACEQYNGFKEDGDYNQEVKEMYYSKLNKKYIVDNKDKLNSSKNSERSNGLCESCNRNQDLKINQLASFVPENENYFDEEVTDYIKQLEQTYKLCSRCDRVLKKTLNNVKRNILGSKLAQIGVKGLKVLDIHMKKANIVKANNKRKFYIKIHVYIIAALSVIHLYNTIDRFSTTKGELDEIFPDKFSNIFLFIIFNITQLKNVIISEVTKVFDYLMLAQVVTYVQSMLKLILHTYYSDGSRILRNLIKQLSDTKFITNIAAIVLNLILLNVNKGLRKTIPLLLLLIWSLEMIFSSNFVIKHFGYNATVYGLLNILTSSITVMLSYKCCNFMKLNLANEQDSSFHKIYTEQSSDLSSDEESDEEIISKSMSSSGTSIKNSRFNNTLDSTQSVHDSIFTTSTLRNYNLERSFNCNNSQYDRMASPYSAMKQPIPVNNVNQYNNFKTLLNSSQNSSSTFGLNNMGSADDNVFYNDIDKLSINNGHLGCSQSSLNQSKNPFSYDYDESNRYASCYTPSVSSEISSYTRQRKNIISPPRLSGGVNGGDANSSWVAGGFWGQTTSPLKKHNNINYNNLNKTFSSTQSQHDFLPILSRTSSQSSGFESHASTINGFFNDDKGICNDIDRASIFSEPAYRKDKIRSNNRYGWNHTALKPQPMYPFLTNTEQTFIHPSTLRSGTQFHSSSNSLYDSQAAALPSYRQFGTQKVRRSLINLDLLNNETADPGDHLVSSSSSVLNAKAHPGTYDFYQLNHNLPNS